MKTKVETWVRLIGFALSQINVILIALGIAPVDLQENVIFAVVSLAMWIYFAIRAFWKNNSFTANAKIADEYLKELKKIGLELMEGEGNDVSEIGQ